MSRGTRQTPRYMRGVLGCPKMPMSNAAGPGKSPRNGKSRGKLHEHHKWGIVHCRGWGDGLWIFPGHWDKIEILGNVPPHDLECVFPTFRMFCWGILPKVECDKILSNPLLSKHGNGQSIKIIHLVGRFPHWHLHVHLMSKLAMFDDRRVQKMSYGNQGLTKDPRFFWK